MTDVTPAARTLDIHEARRLFPATADRVYLNTAAVGLASRRLADTYHEIIDEWTAAGFDYSRGEGAAGDARSAVARLVGADDSDIALIPSVSSAAGLVAAQFGSAGRGENVVIGAREYSSNHFPWRQLAEKGYDVRQVPFRNGGLEPEDVAERLDAGTQLVAFSGVQTATGHRSDIAVLSGLARAVGAIVFVDGAQLVGALPVAHVLPHVDVLAVPDHKFLLNAGRGMGYCYLSPTVQGRFTPVNAGWRAGRIPFESFFGPEMTSLPRRRASTAPSAGSPRSATRLLSPSSTTSPPSASTHATERSPRRCGPRSPTSGGTLSTCPNTTRARSSASRSATASRRCFCTLCPTRGSALRHVTATCDSRCTSTTTKTTSSGLSRRWRP